MKDFLAGMGCSKQLPSDALQASYNQCCALIRDAHAEKVGLLRQIKELEKQRTASIPDAKKWKPTVLPFDTTPSVRAYVPKRSRNKLAVPKKAKGAWAPVPVPGETEVFSTQDIPGKPSHTANARQWLKDHGLTPKSENDAMQAYAEEQFTVALALEGDMAAAFFGSKAPFIALGAEIFMERNRISPFKLTLLNGNSANASDLLDKIKGINQTANFCGVSIHWGANVMSELI